MPLNDKVLFVSKIFRPAISRPWKSGSSIDLVCKSQKLLLDKGLIKYAAGRGLFHILPVLHRSFEKLVVIVDAEMKAIGGNRLSMPLLCDRFLWDKTSRWTLFGEELFKLRDRKDAELCLCPTHEELVTQLVAQNGPLALRQLPLLLYQFGWKFRDEANPRFGMLRSREFFMKDMYSFDHSAEACLESYRAVSDAYSRIFKRMPVPVHVVDAEVGMMGGDLSHEYHLICTGGQDCIDVCQSCGSAFLHDAGHNETGSKAEPSLSTEPDGKKCPHCGDRGLRSFECSEIAHTFVLGKKYSEALNAHFLCDDGQRKPLHMGCYGIGVSRLLAVSVDLLSTDSALRWPKMIVPFKVCVIPPKRFSKESSATAIAEHIATCLADLPNLRDEVLFDDRTDLTVGRRLADAKNLGWLYAIVVNKTFFQKPVPRFELVDIYEDTCEEVTHCELFHRLRNI
ncbi:unnamed protein product [Soboliphyme baturini]|uniref:proline--tRNA ligase n=1 Tax=Soboliphyme baturini TaxID=241478 RepID=A0A183IEJ0_9BILA|nr:unnamed protein product [Soboliphyme baturini]